LLGEGKIPHDCFQRLATKASSRHRRDVILLNGHEQISPLVAVHDVWRQGVPAIEKLAPRLTERVVAAQGLARDARGMRGASNHDEEVWKELPGSEKHCSSFLRGTICCNSCGGRQNVRLQRLIARQRQRFSSAPPQWRAGLRETTAELLGGKRGVVFLELRCATLPAIEDAEHARTAIA
jgi:hypothetical protein